MATRSQSQVYALSGAKQADISSIASTFNRFRKLNSEIHTLDYITETDAAEFGKGNEFIQGVFPVRYDVSGRIEKYGSAEFVLWSWAYGLGSVNLAGGLYTIKPIDPSAGLLLPYFSVIQQLAEGGGSAIDEALLGCSIESIETIINSTPGRQSVRTNVNFSGSGRHALPSGVVVPATLTEAYMLGSSAAVSINGNDYVSDQSALDINLTWNNNLLLNAGYYIGSGTVDNAAVRGRIEIGTRVPGFTFQARLRQGSQELAKLIAQTTGTAVVTLTFDATHTVTWTWPKVSFQSVKRGESDGIVTVQVTVAPQYDTVTSTVVTVTGKCGIADIAQ